MGREAAAGVSIAVMNWVWANSPTSGNERLVLLALADACSRDDGTGCWPSAATIGRKANISDRTVRRVIARLEADGQLLVHRGGARAGSTNSYTVRTGTRNPGHDVTPDNLTGADTSDRPPRTLPCQGTPDTAVSPDPPQNHQGTAAAAMRTPAAADPAARMAAEVGEFFERLAGLNPRWQMTVSQRRRLSPPSPDPACSGRDCGRECRRRPQPVRGPRGTTVVGRTARSPGAGRPPAMVRPVRRAHPDARLRRRRARPLPALQARRDAAPARAPTPEPGGPPALRPAPARSPSPQPTQPGHPPKR